MTYDTKLVIQDDSAREAWHGSDLALRIQIGFRKRECECGGTQLMCGPPKPSLIGISAFSVLKRCLSAESDKLLPVEKSVNIHAKI